ncbi:MAG: ABC transporter ATP-binding protein/permease [Clostridiales bacterium]|nr:ABC transporter ATP-binding protein/permease [Clostridiales bacterium]
MITLKRFIGFMEGKKKYFVGSIIMSSLAVLLSMVPPLIVKLVVDTILGKNPLEGPEALKRAIMGIGGIERLGEMLWICSLGILAATVLNGVCSFFKGRWTAQGAEDIAKRIKDDMYDRLQRMPYDYHVKAQTGDLIQRCTSDVETIRRFMASQMVEIFRILFIMVFSIIIMSSMSVKLTLVAVSLIPIVFAASLIVFKKVAKAFKETDEKEGELQTVLQENLSGVRVVKAFGRQAHEVLKFEEKNRDFRDLVIKLNNLMAWFWGLSDGICAMQIGAVLAVGVTLAISGEISLGTLMVFNTYTGMLIYPMRQLARIISELSRAGVSTVRVSEVLFAKLEEDMDGSEGVSLAGSIEFKNVDFWYDKGNPVLSGLSFKTEPGETIAILGGTGSGKSSLLHLLLRLYDLKSGEVFINGMELRTIKKKWLREKIGIVLQEPFLYSKTVMENIRMADSGASDGDIFESAKTACVHDVIKSFEKGYDTMVGEKGVTLSGGQKQRVAIARTLIKNSDILIFDDSLSAVDTETDSRIRAELRDRRKGVTTFIISQRITTLMEADRIFVMEKGKLSDSGTHEELIAREGLYSRIWSIQSMSGEDEKDLAEAL